MKKALICLIFLSITFIFSACGSSNQALIDEIKALKGNAAKGKPLYNKRCNSCHKADGKGTDLGPDIAKEKGKRETLVKNMVDGNGTMPSFKESLSKQEIADIASYIRDNF